MWSIWEHAPPNFYRLKFPESLRPTRRCLSGQWSMIMVVQPENKYKLQDLTLNEQAAEFMLSIVPLNFASETSVKIFMSSPYLIVFSSPLILRAMLAGLLNIMISRLSTRLYRVMYTCEVLVEVTLALSVIFPLYLYVSTDTSASIFLSIVIEFIVGVGCGVGLGVCGGGEYARLFFFFLKIKFFIHLGTSVVSTRTHLPASLCSC